MLNKLKAQNSKLETLIKRKSKPGTRTLSLELV